MPPDSYLNVPFPWQNTLWQHVCTKFSEEKLAHAILLTGPAGFGQYEFAQAFARHVLTQQNSLHQHLFDNGSHPDFFLLHPEESASVIKINQIRDLQNQLQQTAHTSSYRVVLISPAELLNAAASNALLKLVEEPKPNTLLLFVTHHPQFLPATLRSRCQSFRFTLNEREQTLDWLAKQLPAQYSADMMLALAEEAPFTALELADKQVQQFRKNLFIDITNLINQQISPIVVAEKWGRADIIPTVHFILQCLLDVLRIKFNASQSKPFSAQYKQAIEKIADQLAVGQLFLVLDKLYEMQRLMHAIAGLNKQTLLEEVFIMLTLNRCAIMV